MSNERWDVPGSWQWAQIGDIGAVVGGGTPKNSKDPSNYDENGLPWLTPADLTGYSGTYIARGARSLSKTGLGRSSAKLMPTGTVLFSSRAPIGYCAIAENEISTNQGFKSVVPSPAVVPEFLRYYLLASKDYAEAQASGTTFKELSGSRMAKLAVPLAPLPEQHRIVAKLDALMTRSTAAREALEAIPSLLEQFRQSVLAAAFRGDLTRDWRGTENLSDWQRLSLEDLIDEGPSNGWSPKSGDDAQGALTLKLTATTSGRLRLDEASVKRIYEMPPPSSKYWLRPGDVLIQRANSIEYVGATAIYEGPEQNYIYPDLMMRVRVNDPLTRCYLWRYLNSPEARSLLRSQATGTAGNMPKISGRILKALQVPLPPGDEMAEVVSWIERAFDVADSVLSEFEDLGAKVGEVDQSILAKAFRGELVPQDPNDEPASVLLERIRAEREAAAKTRPKRGRRKKGA